MSNVSLSEADTRAKLIDPALHARGWTEDLIKREETAGAIEVHDGRPRRRGTKRTDYTLRVKVNATAQPVAVALIEAKAEHLPPAHGLEQAKAYGSARRLNVPFVFSSNGHMFVEYDSTTGLTSVPLPISEFPSPEALRARYETARGFSLASPSAAPLLTRYQRGEATRRYYQDAAIRAVLEKLARGEKRALLSLATGAGKTFIAVHLLRRIADAGQLRRALFVCDRDELRTQGAAAFQLAFGADAAVASSKEPQRNARIVIATYQTLGVADEDDSATFLTDNYPPDYFSHIVIDECHRSAWGKWSEVLKRNPNAVQVGLTATPRQIEVSETTDATAEDRRIAADNIRHFGEPVYVYGMGQGIDDGYLAACEVVRREIFLDGKPDAEQVTGVEKGDLSAKQVRDTVTGDPVDLDSLRDRYEASTFEGQLVLPERVNAMCQDLFDHLLITGGPEQKTIVFCARDTHADAVATAMNNLYTAWCAANGQSRADPYAFKCTAKAEEDSLPDLKGATRHHFIATTVDLLTTGVDVPAVRNVVFFKYVRSPIAFYQMVGRGTRIDEATGKLMFRVYDYTNATRLFGADFVTRPATGRNSGRESKAPEPVVQVEGFEVRITDAGRLIATLVDGETKLVTVEEYKERLAAALVGAVPDIEAFRARWINPPDRRALLGQLPDAGQSVALIQQLESLNDYDAFDVLAELGYGQAPRTRAQRGEAFEYKHADWLASLPMPTRHTLKALAEQFERAGTAGLESAEVFNTQAVVKAGGLNALKVLGKAADVLREAKRRLFAA